MSLTQEKTQAWSAVSTKCLSLLCHPGVESCEVEPHFISCLYLPFSPIFLETSVLSRTSVRQFIGLSATLILNNAYKIQAL